MTDNDSDLGERDKEQAGNSIIDLPESAISAIIEMTTKKPAG
jgi:hypothetical protein